MRVAIDISPTKSGHKVRGIGSYTKNLIEEFKKRKWGIEFIFFDKSSTPPPVDVIHYPYFDLFFRTLPIKKTYGRVVTIHDIIPLVFPKYFPAGMRGYINLFFQKRALKNVDAVICDSKTSKDDIASKLSFPENRIHVVYLAAGSDFKQIADRRLLSVVAKKYQLPKNFILYVGDVNWNKNIPNLLEAVKIARIHLVMVGQALVDKNLEQTREIEKIIIKLNLKNKIIRTGYLPEEDLINVYNLASLTVLPSYYEGFGLPVLESMACGTPIICSKLASLAEVSGPDAVFSDPANPADIAKKITQVLNLSLKQKEELSKRLIKHASKFTWEKVAQDTIRVYESII